MTETTQEERDAVQEWAANTSLIRMSANLATRLRIDADRLQRAEELLSEARTDVVLRGKHPGLVDKIDAYFGDRDG